MHSIPARHSRLSVILGCLWCTCWVSIQLSPDLKRKWLAREKKGSGRWNTEVYLLGKTFQMKAFLWKKGSLYQSNEKTLPCSCPIMHSKINHKSLRSGTEVRKRTNPVGIKAIPANTAQEGIRQACCFFFLTCCHLSKCPSKPYGPHTQTHTRTHTRDRKGCT